MTAKDFGLSALNYLGSITGGWNNFTRSSSTDPTAADKLSPEQLAKVVKANIVGNLASLSLKADTIPPASGFDTYLGSRLASIDGFTTVKNRGKTIAEAFKEKLKEPDLTPPDPAKGAVHYVKEAINIALAPSKEARAAGNVFLENMTKIHKEFGKDSKLEFNPQFVLKMLHELKSNAQKAIQAQQTKEIEDLNALFNPPAASTPATTPSFTENLKTSLGITDDSEVKAIQTEMVAALKASHEKELAAFNKGLDEPLKKMHTALQKERDRVFFLATLAAHSPEMQKKIRLLYDARKKKENKTAPGITIQAGIPHPRALFKNIDVTDLKTIQTATGRKLELQADGSYSMDLPNRLFNSRYYHSSHDNLKADFLTMAAAIHCNNDSITFSVEHSSPEHALKLGRAAYAACRETGYDPKKITIEVNGKAVNVNELFKNSSSALRAVNTKAATNAKAREAWDKEMDSDTSYDKYKKAFEAGRMEEHLKQEDQEIAANPPNPTI